MEHCSNATCCWKTVHLEYLWTYTYKERVNGHWGVGETEMKTVLIDILHREWYNMLWKVCNYIPLHVFADAIMWEKILLKLDIKKMMIMLLHLPELNFNVYIHIWLYAFCSLCVGQAAAMTSSSPAVHHVMNVLVSASVCTLSALIKPVM